MAASQFLDGCRFNPTLGGTTDWTYSSLVTGYNTPASANAVNGAQYSYRAESADLSQWEFGTGIWNSGVLTRATVIYSFTGGTFGTSKVSFSTVPTVAIIALAEDLFSDIQRQGILLDRIYQAKALAGYRRVPMAFADGYKASDGVNSGGSANFSVDTTNGKVTLTPTFTVQTPSAVNTTFTFSASGGAAESHLYDGNDTTPAADPAGPQTTTQAAYDFGSAISIRHLRIITAPANGVSNPLTFNIQYSDTSLTTGFTTADTIVIPAGLSQVVQKDIADFGSHRYWRIIYASGTTGGNVWLGELSFSTLNDGLVATTAQTSDATVSNARVLIEYDNTATPALNSDLIAEVTCDGGSHWTTASLSSVSSHSQGGRSVAETVDQACTGGTSFAARVRDHANKTISVYGLSLVIH